MKCYLYNNCSHKDCDKEFCLRKFKTDVLYDYSLLTERQKNHIQLDLIKDSPLDRKDFDAYTRLASISENILDFINEGRSLYLYSKISGNGKTSWSIRFIQSFFNKIWLKSDTKCRAMFISVPKFLIELKASFDEPNEYIEFIKKNILEADLVVWDDIAAKPSTDFEANYLLNLIDNRISYGKSNVYTSNLTPKEAIVSLGSRLCSRICNLSENIELFGTDKRNLTLTKGEE